MKMHVFRLHPGQNLREGIDEYARTNNIRAGIILTCVGNLTRAVLRMADGKTIQNWEESFEIVSLVGTLETGNSHLHICLSKQNGDTIGGHLKEGSTIGVTAEVAIGEIEEVAFERVYDVSTGYDELVVGKVKK